MTAPTPPVSQTATADPSPAGGAGDAVLLEVAGLTVDLVTASGWTPVLEDISFDVRRGEVVGLVGESGSGKSVTGLSIMGLLPARQSRVRSGAIRFGGQTLTAASERTLRRLRGDRIAMVFQEPMTSLNPAFTVGDQIAEAVRVHRGSSRKDARERAVEVLELVGIPAARRRIDSYPHEFSGGMRQRVMIAMAISCEPELLICDEPTTALDVTVQAQVLELLKQLRAEFDMGVLLITHDLAVVAETSDRVVTMYAGEVVERADVRSLFARPGHPYTLGLLHSILAEPDAQGELAYIPGRPPELRLRPPACRFAPRCWMAQDVCRTSHPDLVERDGTLARCHFTDAVPPVHDGGRPPQPAGPGR